MRSIAKYISQKIAIATLVAVAIVACAKQSITDSETAEQLQNRLLNFAPYSPTLATKGVASDNTTLQANGFNVGVYKMSEDLATASQYLPCAKVTYNTTTQEWGYTDNDGNYINRYWPADNSKLTFLAHYPAEGTEVSTDGTTSLFGSERYEAFDASNGDNDLAFKFNYTVHHDADKQYDLIYALREDVSCPETAPYTVYLPFCHALTQVAFTAQLDPTLADDNINITVHSLVLHNLTYSGTMAVKESTGNGTVDNFDNNGVWWFIQYDEHDLAKDATVGANREEYQISEFGAKIASDAGVEVTETKVSLTDSDCELMLMPQHITAWDPDTYKPSSAPFYDAYGNQVTIDEITRTDNSTGLDPFQAGAYIALSCEITQEVDGNTITIHNKEKWLYAPLTTAIDYGDGVSSNEWLAGYKVTYNLIFGGGYTTIPGAENPVQTLTPIGVTANASLWNAVQPDVPLNF